MGRVNCPVVVKDGTIWQGEDIRLLLDLSSYLFTERTRGMMHTISVLGSNGKLVHFLFTGRSPNRPIAYFLDSLQMWNTESISF